MFTSVPQQNSDQDWRHTNPPNRRRFNEPNVRNQRPHALNPEKIAQTRNLQRYLLISRAHLPTTMSFSSFKSFSCHFLRPPLTLSSASSRFVALSLSRRTSTRFCVCSARPYSCECCSLLGWWENCRKVLTWGENRMESKFWGFVLCSMKWLSNWPWMIGGLCFYFFYFLIFLTHFLGNQGENMYDCKNMHVFMCDAIVQRKWIKNVKDIVICIDL